MGKAVTALADYAFTHLGYQSVYGEIVENNSSSLRVLEKAGFVPTERGENKVILTKQAKL